MHQMLSHQLLRRSMLMPPIRPQNAPPAVTRRMPTARTNKPSSEPRLAAHSAVTDANRPLKAVLDELRAMLDLLKASATGAYHGLSKASLLLIAGAVVYFLMPTDLLPDFIFGAGYIDDAMVITWVIATTKEELAKFKRWRAVSGQ